MIVLRVQYTTNSEKFWLEVVNAALMMKSKGRPTKKSLHSKGSIIEIENRGTKLREMK